MNVSQANAYNVYNNYNQPSVNATKGVSSDTDEIKTEQNQKVLGYEVDKNGYFSSDLNKAAGISEDIKIDAKSVQSFVDSKTTKTDRFADYDSIDVAKTLHNAYNSLENKEIKTDKMTDALINQVKQNPNQIEGNVSYVGRLKGLDENMSADEFRIQIGLVNAQYDGLKDQDLQKAPDHIKDIVNFVSDLKNLKNEQVQNPISSVYNELKDDEKATFKELQQQAKDAIIELNHSRSDNFASLMFGGAQQLGNAQQNAVNSLDDFTAFYMKAQDFFNKSKDDMLDATQTQIKNAFTNLYSQQANLQASQLNLLA